MVSCVSDLALLTLAEIADPMTINGTIARATSATFQEKINASTIPPKRENIASAMVAKPSVLTPLSCYTSDASVALRMPAALS